MKTFVVSCLLISALCLSASAQSYSIDWYKIAGGGGTSTNGNYSLTGGFWSLISVVQTPGLPDLLITHSGHSVIISWPDTGSYTLQQNSNLSNSGSWTTSGYSVTTANGTNSITISSPAGNLFFRLQSP